MHTEHSSGHRLPLFLLLGLPADRSTAVIAATEIVAAGFAESVAEAVASVDTAAAVGKTVVAGMDSVNMDFHT